MSLNIIDDFFTIMPICGYKRTKSMNQDTKRYIKNCKLLFPIYDVREKRYLEEITRYIGDDLTYDEIVEQFGTPLEIMLAYLNEQNDEYFIFRAKYYRNTVKFIWIAIFLALLL